MRDLIKNGLGPQNAIRLAWERLEKKAGVTDLRFHDLRHEAISRFFEMGLFVPEVALISGHRDLRMLFRHTHSYWDYGLKGVSMEQAAVHLLLEFWKDDVVQNDLDEFHWINEEAHLFVAELGAIAREMWRS